MPDRQIDPARLEGEELRRWHQRTPKQIEEERRSAAAQRHAEFFGGSSAKRQEGALRKPLRASSR